MSDSLPSPASTDDLQFARVEDGTANAYAAPSTPRCAACQQPITSTYYALADHVLCPACRETANVQPPGGKIGRLFKASLMGLGAGLAGALIWYVIRLVANREFGLVAILVGLMVGGAVRKGSGGLGGRGYQVLAVLITYCSIAANYVPDILEVVFRVQQPVAAADDVAAGPAQPPQARDGSGEAVLTNLIILALVCKLALMCPFLGGAQNVIGLLIIGFALWEAWKINARRSLPISGPYQIGTGTTA